MTASPAPSSTYSPSETASALPTESYPASSSVAASPAPSSTTAPGSGSSPSQGQCSTGPMQCCNSVQEPSSENAQKLAGLLNIVLDSAPGNVGVGCSALVGGSGCSSTPVCCSNNQYNGLVNVGCVPIVVNL
ncbi:fungal hydrophobin-domain-containing protein [Amylocystis lapponica]|nr:fungal hydrophobin-domain-containing protein [Amylocystis lapponica]